MFIRDRPSNQAAVSAIILPKESTFFSFLHIKFTCRPTKDFHMSLFLVKMLNDLYFFPFLSVIFLPPNYWSSEARYLHYYSSHPSLHILICIEHQIGTSFKEERNSGFSLTFQELAMNLILLFILASLVPSSLLLEVQAAHSQPTRTYSQITVMGLVYCDTCSNNSFSKHSYFLSGNA